MPPRRPSSRPSKPRPGPDLVARWLAGGWLLENRHGYRCSPELELLPEFLGEGEPRGRVVELGSGNGALLLAALSEAAPGPPALGLELQASLVPLAERNAALRALQRPVRFLHADVRHPPIAPESQDWVLFNPPFFPPSWGREAAHAERHRSTHALAGDVGDFCTSACALLRPGGRAVAVYTPDRLAELLQAFAASGLLPTRLRFVRHQPRDKVLRLLCEAAKPGGDAAPAAGLRVDEQEYDFEAHRA